MNRMGNDQEWEIARLVSLYSERYRGERLGEAVLNDDGSEDGMFDFRFDHADPPVALEITSIRRPGHDETLDAVDRLENELSHIMKEEGLPGTWFFGITTGTVLKYLKKPLLEFIRANNPSAEPPAGIDRIFLETESGQRVEFCVWNSSPTGLATPLSGFVPELERAIRENKSKLGKAVGYECHLAVHLQDVRARDPASTPVPCLPDEIDVLWVLDTSIMLGRTEPMAWWSTGEGWSLSHPLPWQ